MSERETCDHCGLVRKLTMRPGADDVNGLCDQCVESRGRRAKLVASPHWNTLEYWASVGCPISVQAIHHRRNNPDAVQPFRQNTMERCDE